MKQELRGYVRLIPDLRRQQPRGIRESFHRADVELHVMTGRELIMPTLSGQQRPRPPAPIAGEGPAIILLPVSVVRIASKTRPLRKIVPERGVDDSDGSLDQRIVRFANSVANQLEESRVDHLGGGKF